MSERAVRFAMIGAGGHSSESIYPALRFTNLHLVAVADLDEQRAQTIGGRFGNPRIYTDYQKMLADEELDAVGVVGPPKLHHQAGLAVLQSGRHLFTEKPPAPDLAGARELQAMAAKQGVLAMTGFMKRHAATYVRAKEISQRPEFGRRTVLRLNYSHWNVELLSHLIYMSVHPLDLARYFMGDVAAGTVAKRDIGGNHVLALLLQHTDGGISQVTLSAHEPRVQESVELAGESALIQVHNLVELRYLPRTDRGHGSLPDGTKASVWYPEITIPGHEANNHILQGYAGELQHFAEAVANQTSLSELSGSIDDGVEAMRLVHALLHAPEGLSELQLPD